MFDIWRNFGQRAWPWTCHLCGAHTAVDRALCAACARSLPLSEPACSRCAAALFDNADECGHCQRHPPAYGRTRACYRYLSPVDHLIYGMKYAGKLHLAHLLGELMADRLTNVVHRPDVIIPVPLHPRRLRERGFNQALELARPIARRLDIALDYRIAQRVRNTPTQTALAPKLRERNVRNAFSIKGKLAGVRVAIVDDVMTTGHTANAFAACLIKAGASNVEVWVAARA